MLICYKLDASQVGAVSCLLQSGAWVFAAALFILQLLIFCWGLHGTNACCSHNEAFPISPPLVATRFLMDSVTAGQGLLGYFTCTCNASVKAGGVIRFSGAQERTQSSWGLTQELVSEANQGMRAIPVAIIILVSIVGRSMTWQPLGWGLCVLDL